jgi:hypothetical protein
MLLVKRAHFASKAEQEEQLEEFRCGWYKQLFTIQKVIELERHLGHPPDLWYLYISGKFTNAEIDFLNENGISYWLLDGPISSAYNDQPVGDGSNSELCNIIRLCPSESELQDEDLSHPPLPLLQKQQPSDATVVSDEQDLATPSSETVVPAERNQQIMVGVDGHETTDTGSEPGSGDSPNPASPIETPAINFLQKLRRSYPLQDPCNIGIHLVVINRFLHAL